MPNPKEIQSRKLSDQQQKMLSRIGVPSIFDQGQSPDLASEIAALRRDIADLRTALTPVPSLILTGQSAIDEFKRITGAKP